jgi:hypothetical protein
MRCITTFNQNVIDESVSDWFYEYLKNNIQWEEGVRSKKGFTRKAKSIEPGTIPELDQIVNLALSKLTNQRYHILGLYINYYENGIMYTPAHSHPKTHQLVISLGATRTLTVGKKQYEMNKGSAIIFGSSTHSVPKSDIKEGRISIATFMIPQ